MLDAIAMTAQQTLAIIVGIRELMSGMRDRLRAELPKVYSQDLLNNLYQHPYTKISYVQRDLNVSRPTATSYLEQLAAGGFLARRKAGRSIYYINDRLIACLANVPELPREAQ